MTEIQIQQSRTRLGNKISELRLQKKWTQQELADKTGLLRNNISRIESGQHSIGIDILERIGIALGYMLDFVPREKVTCLNDLVDKDQVLHINWGERMDSKIRLWFKAFYDCGDPFTMRLLFIEDGDKVYEAIHESAPDKPLYVVNHMSK